MSALVIVHPTTAGDLVLPFAESAELAWARAEHVVRDLHAHLPRGRQAVSMAAVTALLMATEGPVEIR